MRETHRERESRHQRPAQAHAAHDVHVVIPLPFVVVDLEEIPGPEYARVVHEYLDRSQCIHLFQYPGAARCAAQVAVNRRMGAAYAATTDYIDIQCVNFILRREPNAVINFLLAGLQNES